MLPMAPEPTRPYLRSPTAEPWKLGGRATARQGARLATGVRHVYMRTTIPALVLAGAVVTVITVGIGNLPMVQGQTPTSPEFDAASVKLISPAGGRGGGAAGLERLKFTPGRVYTGENGISTRGIILESRSLSFGCVSASNSRSTKLA